MSTVANLDVNCRGNTKDLDTKLDGLAKRVKQHGQQMVEVLSSSHRTQEEAFAARFAKEQKTYDQSYEAYAKYQKDAEAANKKAQEEAAKTAKKAQDDRKKALAQEAVGAAGAAKTRLIEFMSMAGNLVSSALSGSVKTFLGGVSSAAQQAATMFGGPVAGAIAGAISTAAMAIYDVVERVVKRVAEALIGMASLARTAKTLGTGARTLAELQYAGQMAGLGIGEANAALTAFSQNMLLAGRGVGPSLEALRRLNLRGKELAAMPLDQKLELFADRLAQVGNAGDRLSLARDVGLEALLPVIEKGGAGLRELREEAKKLGVGDPAAAKAAVEAQRAWRQLGAAFDSVWNSLSAALAPGIRDISRVLADLGKRYAQWISEAIRMWSVYAETVGKVARVLINVGVGVAKAVQSFLGIGTVVGSATTMFESFKERALRAMFAVQWVAENWKDAIGLVFDFARLKVVGFGHDVVNVFTKVIPAAVEGLRTAFERIKAGDFKGAFAGLEEQVRKAMDRPKTELELALERRVNAKLGDLGKFVDEKMRQFKAGAQEDVKDGPPMQGLPMKAAAMEFGSKEAFSTIYGTQDAQAKALNVANQQLDENKQMKRLLQRIVDGQKGKGIQRARI